MSNIYTMAAYKHDYGQTITTDIEGVELDRAFLAHLHIVGADVPVKDTVSVMALTKLVAADGEDDGTRKITEGLTNPAYPRNVRVVSDTADITSKIKVHGTNIADEVISEEIQLNGTTAKSGLLVFKTITAIDLPAATGTEKVSVGLDDLLGFPYFECRLLQTYFDNQAESTAPAITINKDVIAKNTIKLNSALNTKDVDVYLIV